MANMRITITDNFDGVLSAVNDNINLALEAAGLEMERNAKLELERFLRRIDTGRLRNSITHTVKNNAAYVGTNVQYAPYVHEGVLRPNGTRMLPNRFLKNAIANNIDKYQQIFRDYLRNI